MRESEKTIGHRVVSKILPAEVMPEGIAKKIKTAAFSYDDLDNMMEENIKNAK